MELTIEDVITVKHYIEALKMCMKDVSAKHSVQNYRRHAIHHIAEAIEAIRKGELPPVRHKGEIEIRERGKSRLITPITIEDRVTQRVICEYALIPALEKKLIYDNGASAKGKGTHFSRRRLNGFLEKAKRRWGPENIWALQFDFSGYFASIPHSECYRVLDEAFEDKRLRDLAMRIIESYAADKIEAIEDPDERDRMMAKLRRHELKGICLGSQISQIMALAVPNPVDHLIKDKLGCEFYTRHMDDGIILLDSRERLEEIRETIKKEAEKHGLILNPRKTRIVRFKDGFTFLKVRYRADGYKTIRTIAKSSVVRQRRKLKKFGPKLCAGAMTEEDVKASMVSWEASTRGTRSFRRIRAMRRKYRAVLKENKNEIL